MFTSIQRYDPSRCHKLRIELLEQRLALTFDLIGIDFDQLGGFTGDGIDSPANWHSFTREDFALEVQLNASDLFDVQGTRTEVDVSLRASVVEDQPQLIVPRTIPASDMSLSGLDGAIEMRAGLRELVWSELEPNTTYEFFEFNLGDTGLNIELPTDLFINGQSGSSSRELSTYSVLRTSSQTGELSVSLRAGLLAGVALRPFEGRNDLIAEGLTLRDTRLLFDYTVRQRSEFSVDIYWASGEKPGDRIGSPAFGPIIPTSTGSHQYGVDTTTVSKGVLDFADRPESATHVQFVLDDRNDVEESDEANNHSTIELSDVRISSLSWSESNEGGIDITYGVWRPATEHRLESPVELEFVWSEDRVFDEDDKQAVDRKVVTTLTSDTLRIDGASFIHPGPNQKYLIAKIDGGETLPELTVDENTGENNNTSSLLLSFETPDIEIRHPNSPQEKQRYKVEVIVENSAPVPIEFDVTQTINVVDHVEGIQSATTGHPLRGQMLGSESINTPVVLDFEPVVIESGKQASIETELFHDWDWIPKPSESSVLDFTRATLIELTEAIAGAGFSNALGIVDAAIDSVVIPLLADTDIHVAHQVRAEQSVVEDQETTEGSQTYRVYVSVDKQNWLVTSVLSGAAFNGLFGISLGTAFTSPWVAAAFGLWTLNSYLASKLAYAAAFDPPDPNYESFVTHTDPPIHEDRSDNPLVRQIADALARHDSVAASVDKYDGALEDENELWQAEQLIAAFDQSLFASLSEIRLAGVRDLLSPAFDDGPVSGEALDLLKFGLSPSLRELFAGAGVSAEELDAIEAYVATMSPEELSAGFDTRFQRAQAMLSAQRGVEYLSRSIVLRRDQGIVTRELTAAETTVLDSLRDQSNTALENEGFATGHGSVHEALIIESRNFALASNNFNAVREYLEAGLNALFEVGFQLTGTLGLKQLLRAQNTNGLFNDSSLASLVAIVDAVDQSTMGGEWNKAEALLTELRTAITESHEPTDGASQEPLQYVDSLLRLFEDNVQRPLDVTGDDVIAATSNTVRPFSRIEFDSLDQPRLFASTMTISSSNMARIAFAKDDSELQLSDGRILRDNLLIARFSVEGNQSLEVQPLSSATIDDIERILGIVEITRASNEDSKIEGRLAIADTLGITSEIKVAMEFAEESSDGESLGVDEINLTELGPSAGVELKGATIFVDHAGDVNGDGLSDLILLGGGNVHIVYGGKNLPEEIDLQNLGDGGVVLSGLRSVREVGGIGDFNSDGFDDVIIGDMGNSRVLILFGEANLPSSLDLSNDEYDGVEINLSNTRGAHERFGDSVSGDGDFNGDGVRDALIGSPNASVGIGRAFVLFGGADTPSQLDASDLGQHGMMITGGDDTAVFQTTGDAIAFAGDVNADGLDDVIVGAPSSPAAYIVYGGQSLEVVTLGDQLGERGVSIQEETRSDSLGRAVAGVGDVNADGFDDLLLSNTTSGFSPRAYLVFGAEDLPFSLNLAESDDLHAELIGLEATNISLSGAGDINGDGISDILIGDQRHDPDPSTTGLGASYGILGNANLGSVIDVSTDFNLKLVGSQFASLGDSVSDAGDANGDGHPDFAISDGQTTYLIFGEATNPNDGPVLNPIGNKTIAELELLEFTATASVPNDGSLFFSLDEGAPAGSTIDSASGVFRWTPTETDGGQSFAFTIRVGDNATPLSDDFETILVSVIEVDSPPTLLPIGDQIVNEGDELTFVVTATDDDLPVNNLVYSLESGAPNGATIDPASGAFRWTPDEQVGGNSIQITVRVTDDTGLTDTQSTTVIVNDVNSSPVLDSIGDQFVTEGTELTFTATASDPDIPTNNLTFSLGPGAPTGATIDPATGEFRWTPGIVDASNQAFITVRVTDNGVPPLDDSEEITIRMAGSLVETLSSPLPEVMRFGQSVALSGSTLVAGARGNTSTGGFVGVYDVGGTVPAVITPSSQDDFAYAVALDGTTMAVSSPFSENFGGSVGTVHIYDLIGGAQRLVASLANPVNRGFTFFGASVALNGSRIVVGNHATSFGEVYLYEVDGDSVTFTHTLSNPSQSADSFGWSVAVSDSRIAVGAYGDDNQGLNTGQVYVYDVHDGSLLHTVVSPAPIPREEFGMSVSLDGTNLLVATVGTGTAFVYDVSGPIANLTHTLRPEKNGTFGRCISCVSLSGDTAAIGNLIGEGIVYIYDLSGEAPVLANVLNNPSPDNTSTTPPDNFGWTVSADGSVIAVGAPHDDTAGPNAGSVYVFPLEAEEVPEPIVLGGDANGDGAVGFADFLVLSQNFGTLADAVFGDGDFDEDGDVDFTDFLILSGNFGKLTIS